MEQRQQLAVRFALKGIARDPWRLVDKSVDNFWHFLRPEGLHNLLLRERSIEPWRHAVHRRPRGCVPGPADPAAARLRLRRTAFASRTLILLWLAYYLFMVIVVFGNEVPRFRSPFMPFALAGAAGGVQALAAPGWRRRPLVWIGLAPRLLAGGRAPRAVRRPRGPRARGSPGDAARAGRRRPRRPRGGRGPGRRGGRRGRRCRRGRG